MFTLIEAKDYKSLHYVQQSLGSIQVLVGPNAAGKTSFLDTISFLSDFVTEGLDEAIGRRSSNFRDLLWCREGNRMELAIEAAVPDHLQKTSKGSDCDRFRYEVVIGIDEETQENAIFYEIGSLQKSKQVEEAEQALLFPRTRLVPDTVVGTKGKQMTVFSKKPEQQDNYYPENRRESGKGGWIPAFKLGTRRSTLANLPEDESKFPITTWFKQLLSAGVQKFILNSRLIQLPSPPGQTRKLKPDGSNLPWVIHHLEQKHPERITAWFNHVRTALPDIEAIRTIERQEDRHRYLAIRYSTGVELPSWTVSDGTLRLLALTLPAYLPDITGTFLIEEPENGIHPRAVESMFQSLSSVYNAQILLATHSPVILSVVDLNQVLCVAKTSEGATDIIAGHKHPALRDWQGEENLGVLFAGGVLG